MIKDGLEYVKCNECGRICLKLEMTDDRRMCKDCYIKWIEAQYKKLREQIPTEEKDYLVKLTGGSVEPIKCANCKCPIYLSEKEIKKRCLYLIADWTKCLCPSCTDEWKMKKESAG